MELAIGVYAVSLRQRANRQRLWPCGTARDSDLYQPRSSATSSHVNVTRATRSCRTVHVMAEHNRPCQQKDLVEIIQSVHTSLRKKAETVRPDDVWEEHCKDVSTLSKYREAMKKLATEHWEQSVANERITWSVDTVREYFRDGGLQRALDKDERRRKYEEQQKDERAIRPRQTAIPRHLYSRSVEQLL